MPNLGTPEILIIAVVVVLLFGATKLPQMARSLGQSARVFKAETRGMKNDDSQANQDQASGASAQQSSQQAPSQQAPSQQAQPPQQLTSGEQGSAPFSQANGQGFQQGSQQQPQNSQQQNDPKN